MNTQIDFAAIDALDLEPIKMKLMHGPSGEGWSRQQADAVELEYRRFLYLMKTFPGEQSAPLCDVDIFWHYHILDTVKYMQDCEAVFGHYLHHYPYLGLGGDEHDEEAHEHAGSRMQELYDGVFGSGAFVRAARQLDATRQQTAWCVIPPCGPRAGATNEASLQLVHAGTAWCVIPPASKADKAGSLCKTAGEQAVMTAWCVIPPASREHGGAARDTLAKRNDKAATAWCVIPPAAPQRTPEAAL